MPVGVLVPLSGPPDPRSFFIPDSHDRLGPLPSCKLDETGFPICQFAINLAIRNSISYDISMNSQLPIALHIMGFLAFSRGDALTSEVLAATYGTSPVVLRRVLAKLKRAGLVQSRRGVGGGSILARPADAVTLREVYEAITDDTKLMPPVFRELLRVRCADSGGLR